MDDRKCTKHIATAPDRFPITQIIIMITTRQLPHHLDHHHDHHRTASPSLRILTKYRILHQVSYHQQVFSQCQQHQLQINNITQQQQSAPASSATTTSRNNSHHQPQHQETTTPSTATSPTTIQIRYVSNSPPL